MMDVLEVGELQRKTFVFQREETQQSMIVDYEVDLRQNFININNLLTTYCAPQHHKVCIYDPNSNAFASLNKLGALNGFLHKQFLEPSVILIRYKRKTTTLPESDSADSSLQGQFVGEERSSEKQESRSKERSIAETIELVKRWRELHLHGHPSLRRRLNLQDAARLVGVSKKSLDDYYCQLRLGEFYGFDFASSLQEKMGVLRTFVKEHKDHPSDRQRRRRQNQKHPKSLHVIEQFQLDTKTLLLPSQQDQGQSLKGQEEMLPEMERSRSVQSGQDEPLLEERFQEIDRDPIQLFQELSNLEHEFFRGFELVLDEPTDPYREIQRDFRKKDWDDGDSFLYFND